MPIDLSRYEGKKFCVVFMKDNEDPDVSTVKLRTLHGRANIIDGAKLQVEHRQGSFLVPSSAYNAILESDGNAVLRDAEYYVICKVSGMEL